MFGVYVVLRYVPNYPLTAANPSDAGTPVATRQEILDAVVQVSVIILLALGAIGLTGGWFLAGWILRPIQNINNAAHMAAAGRLDYRMRLTGRNDEFRQLADSFDHMMDRIDSAFRTQERFAANASHELRTPLAVMETMLDVACRHPEEQDYSTLIDRLSITNARAIRLTEALLRLADVNAISAISEPVDLAAIVRNATEENAGEAAERAIAIDLQLDAAPTFGDATLLGQLASNLVQNAIRHNVPSGSARIVTRHHPRQSAVVLQIENTGPHYTPEVAARLSEPFLRGEGRISRAGSAQKGHGLGLTLVSRITQVHHGDLSIAPREGGGLVITVTLPDSDRKRDEPSRSSDASPQPTRRRHSGNPDRVAMQHEVP